MQSNTGEESRGDLQRINMVSLKDWVESTCPTSVRPNSNPSTAKKIHKYDKLDVKFFVNCKELLNY
jgi:hypothetical protein